MRNGTTRPGTTRQGQVVVAQLRSSSRPGLSVRHGGPGLCDAGNWLRQCLFTKMFSYLQPRGGFLGVGAFFHTWI